MSSLLQWFTSESWAHLVSALLHTLWIGGLVVGGLLLVLRKEARPASRYRWCVGALLAIVAGGVVTWAVLQAQPAERRISSVPASSVRVEQRAPDSVPPEAPSFAQVKHKPPGVDSSSPWRTWLALLWLAGVAAMLTRASLLVSKAQTLPRRCTPLDNDAVLKLIDEARRQLGVARRIRAVVAEQLSSPAVIGVIVPTLVLPLSLITTMPLEQLRLIVLHELAHVRRGDYLVNLLQLLVESLLFFNPAVWWVSRQVRSEREACCDSLATNLAGGHLQYAQALAEVAEGTVLAAPAFGARRNSFALKDRIQRLLVPGYHPPVSVTWLPLLVALVLGGGLLCLSALGARATIVAILSARERMDRIEKKMIQFGQKPVPSTSLNGEADYPVEQVKISGRIRRADGKPVPEHLSVLLHSSREQNGYSTSVPARNGVFNTEIRAGSILLAVDAEGYAPVSIGPFDALTTNRSENLELVLEPGFDVKVQIVDAGSGAPVANAKVATAFNLASFLANSRTFESSADGVVTVPHCAKLPMQIKVNHPAYEIIQRKFRQIRPGEPLKLELRAGQPVSGVVLDQTTGEPIAGAELRLLYQTGAVESERFSWTDAMHLLGRTDANGRFVLHQLRRPVRYWVGISAPQHEAKILPNVSAGQEKLIVKLGPELVIRGRVIGSLDGLQIINDTPVLRHSFTETYENHPYSDGDWLPLRTNAGEVRFEFTNRVAGLVRISSGLGAPAEREVTEPVNDWLIDLDSLRKTNSPALPTREVVFRFISPAGASPRGTVAVSIPDSLDPKHLTAHQSELEITNSEIRAQIPIGGRTSLEPKRMIGYWFDPSANNGSLYSLQVTNGAGPMVVEIPVLPAGAVFAKARNPDGSPAGGLFFGIRELKRAPGRSATTLPGNSGDSYSNETPRKWVSDALPLGGTYQVYAWRGNTFALSKPVKLTESSPDAEIELQLPTGKTFDGLVLDPKGQTLRDAELELSFQLPDGHGFGLKSLSTDYTGHFRIENTTPEIGEYAVVVHAPGVMAERFRLNFRSQPQTIRVKPGRTLAGRVVEGDSGYPLPNAEVRTWESSGRGLLHLSTRTDANGRFEFNSLSDATYSFSVNEGRMTSAFQFRADGNTNLLLAVKLYAWSKAKPLTNHSDQARLNAN